MSLFRRTPPRTVPSVSGVFHSDPANPPPPPADAKAIEIRNSSNEIIAYAWVVSRNADEAFYNNAWAHLSRCDTAIPSSDLRLVP